MASSQANFSCSAGVLPCRTLPVITISSKSAYAAALVIISVAIIAHFIAPPDVFPISSFGLPPRGRLRLGFLADESLIRLVGRVQRSAQYVFHARVVSLSLCWSSDAFETIEHQIPEAIAPQCAGPRRVVENYKRTVGRKKPSCRCHHDCGARGQFTRNRHQHKADRTPTGNVEVLI